MSTADLDRLLAKDHFMLPVADLVRIQEFKRDPGKAARFGVFVGLAAVLIVLIATRPDDFIILVSWNREVFRHSSDLGDRMGVRCVPDCFWTSWHKVRKKPLPGGKGLVDGRMILNLLDLDGPSLWCDGLLVLRQVDGQDAVGIAGLDLVFLHMLRQLEAALASWQSGIPGACSCRSGPRRFSAFRQRRSGCRSRPRS